jgi:type IV secretory pathway VirB4 component
MVSDIEEEQVDGYSLTKTKSLEFFEMYFGMQDGLQPLSEISNGYSTLSDAIDVVFRRNDVDPQDESTYEKQAATISDLSNVLQEMAEEPENFSDIDTEPHLERKADSAATLYEDIKPITEKSGEFYGLSKETDEKLQLEQDSHKVHYINLKTREDSDKRGLMMQILLSRVYEMAKNTDDNVVVYMDEAHMMLKDERTSSYLEKVVRHSRHEHLGINFVTQRIEDFFQSEAGKTIGGLCSMIRILYTESGVDDEEIRNILDLEPHHVNYIQSAQVGNGSRPSESLLKIGKKGYVPNLVVASEMEQEIIG